MKKIISGFLFLLLCCSMAAEDQEYDVIYAINFFDGRAYNSTIVPYSAPEICILADHVNAFVVRETALYYWPLTSEFKADWAARNVPLPGTLCIRDQRGRVTRIEAQDYVIQYDIKDIPGTIGVYWGDEAARKHAEFTRAQRNYSEAAYNYSKAMEKYNQAVNEYLQRAAELTEMAELGSFPEVPAAPADFTVLSTDVNTGFPVELPAGLYSLYFEGSDGAVVPKTKKRLRVFEPRERVRGFQVFEEGRWTVPADFPGSRMRLFTIPGGVLYLQPSDYLHYEGSAYNLMMNPQNRYSGGESSIWMPVPLDTPQNYEQNFVLAGQSLDLLGYKVTQLAGSKLGYIITPLELGDPESAFSAFQFNVPAKSEGATYSLGETSAVTVLRIFFGLEAVILLASLIPMIVFVLISLNRRRFRCGKVSI